MERKEYAYKIVDDVPIHANVYYDRQRAEGKKLPIAIHFHGGNLVVGSKEMLSPHQTAKLVDLGFIVVSANYRLCPTISIYEGPIKDALDAYEWSRTALLGLLNKDTGIELDDTKVVAFGHSCGATLALLTNHLPPQAILDIFGMKYLSDPFYHTAAPPPPSGAPTIDLDFANKVYEETPAPSSGPFPVGPTGPNLSTPRPAWVFNAIRQGTLIQSILGGDDNYAKVDPATLFTRKDFPPVYFIHGTDDKLVPAEFSSRTYDDLRAVGVETELVLVLGAAHGFDARAGPGDDFFDMVTRGFEFLRRHV